MDFIWRPIRTSSTAHFPLRKTFLGTCCKLQWLLRVFTVRDSEFSCFPRVDRKWLQGFPVALANRNSPSFSLPHFLKKVSCGAWENTREMEEEDMPESLSGTDGQTSRSGYDKGPKNIPWCRNKILDLLDIWGAARFQNRLKESHRNLDIFKDIADEMKKRNHARTGEECRTKTKHMRFEYRKVVNYNKMSGRDPISCPYFKELDDILHGDASIVVNRLSRSIDLARGNQAVASNRNVQSERKRKGLGKSVPSNVPMVPPACNSSMESSARAILEETEIGNGSNSNTRQENCPQDENDSSCNSPEQELDTSDGREDNPQDERFTVVNMSPNTRLQRIRNRSRRAVRGELIARTIMENTNQQSEIGRQWRENLQKDILLRMDESACKESELLNIIKEDVNSSKEDRRQLLHCMSSIVDLLRKSRPPSSLYNENSHIVNTGVESQNTEILVPDTLPEFQDCPHVNKYTRIQQDKDKHVNRPPLFGLTMYNNSSDDSETDDDLFPDHNFGKIAYMAPDKYCHNKDKDMEGLPMSESNMSSVRKVVSEIKGNEPNSEVEPLTNS